MKKIYFPILFFLLISTLQASPKLTKLEKIEKNPQAYRGKKLRVLVKIISNEDNIFTVYGSKIRFFVEDSSLKNTTDLIEPDSNIYFEGTLSFSPTLRFIVTDSAPASDDEELVRDQLDNLELEEDFRGMKQLGDETVRKGRLYKNKTLLALAVQAYLRYLKIKEKKARENKQILSTFKQKFFHALEYYTLVHQRKASIQRLVKLYDKYPSHRPALRKVLQDPRSLNCIEIYSGKGFTWLTQEEYRKRKGIVKYEGKWLGRDIVIFEDFLRGYLHLEKNSIYYNFSKIFKTSRLGNFVILIERGEIGTGMYKEEMIRSWGYPQRVYVRLSEEGKRISLWRYTRTESWFDKSRRTKVSYSSPHFYVFFEDNMMIRALTLKEIESKYKKKK